MSHCVQLLFPVRVHERKRPFPRTRHEPPKFTSCSLETEQPILRASVEFYSTFPAHLAALSVPIKRSVLEFYSTCSGRVLLNTPYAPSAPSAFQSNDEAVHRWKTARKLAFRSMCAEAKFERMMKRCMPRVMLYVLPSRPPWCNNPKPPRLLKPTPSNAASSGHAPS